MGISKVSGTLVGNVVGFGLNQAYLSCVSYGQDVFLYARGKGCKYSGVSRDLRLCSVLRAYPKNGYPDDMSTESTPKRTHARTPNTNTKTGVRISNEQWAILEPLLPVHVNTHRHSGGRPRLSNRRCADTISYVLCTSCQWAALHATDLCPISAVYDHVRA